MRRNLPTRLDGRSILLLAGVLFALLGSSLTGSAHAATAPSWSLPAPITTQAPFADHGTLTQISCAGSGECFAGAVGQSATGEIYAATGGALDWTSQRPADTDGGGPFACSPDSTSTSSFCVALDGSQVENLSISGAPVTGPADPDVLLGLAAAMSCPTSGLCVAVGSTGKDGEVSWSTDPLTGDWTSADLDTGHQLLAISCPETSLCVAVDNGGGVLVSTDPAGGVWTRTQLGTGLDAVSCATDALCVAVGSTGGIYVSTAPADGTWRTEYPDGASTSDGADLTGVSCPTTSFCAISSGAGDIIASSDAANSAFFPIFMNLPAGLGAISCPVAEACDAVAGGNVVEVGFAQHGGWESDTVGVDAWTPLAAVSCPSSALCVAFQQDGRVDTTTAPLNQATDWTVSSADPGGTPVGASCVPTATACFGVDSDGRLLWSTAPATGVWSRLRLDLKAKPVAISCPTTSFCAFADAGGRIFTSTDPTGGAKAWHMISRATPAKLAHGLTETLTSITCTSATFCLVTDSGGWIYTSTDPRGRASGWTATQIWKRPGVGNYSLTAASCPSSSNCTVMGTYAGWYSEAQYDPDALGSYALTSTHPAGGAAKWTSRHIDNGYVESDASTVIGGLATGLSCPTTSLCATVDSLGTADTNTGVASASTWQQASIDSLGTPDTNDGTEGLTAVSCFRGGHCVAVDGAGNRYVFGIGAGPATPTTGITFGG